jgi:hypothetical protein
MKRTVTALTPLMFSLATCLWAQTQTPYGGTNAVIADGSTIQAENYDVGGEGVAYHDTTTGNTGGQYRSDDVDIEATGDAGGGYNVGWIVDGEWLEYTVNATAGTYDITARVASAGAAVGDLQVLLDGVVLGTIPVNATGGWQTFADATLTGVSIPGGNNRVLRLQSVNGGDFNINYVRFATTPSGSNLAQSKPVTASSALSPYVATNANDGNLTTYWESAGSFPASLAVSLGANFNITSVVVKLNPDPVWATRTQTIQVLGHTLGGTTFTSLVGAATYTFNPSTGNSVTIPVTATVSDVELTVTSNSGAPGAQVAELQVIGSAGTAPTPTRTSTPTATATSTPTPTTRTTVTATATPTATTRSTPTSTATATATATATTRSTPTPTATSTPTPTSSTPTPTTLPSSNLAQGKPIAASSVNQTYVATNANDGDVTTYWEGSAYPATLTVSLGANANITSVVVKLNPDPVWATRTQTIQVMGHNQTSTTFTNLVSAATYTFDPSSGANTVTIPVTATVSDVQLVFTTNSGAPGGQCAELQVLGTPAPNPDLTITSFTWSPASPFETDALTLTAVVKNVGSLPAAASNVNFYLGTTLAGTGATPVLAAGASAIVSVNIAAQNAGTYAVSAKVNEAQALIELNYSNNTATGSMVVNAVASSDLVGAPSWSPGNPSGGNTVSFTVNLLNQGNVGATNSAHGITLTLKTAAGATVQTFSGSYTGALSAGASVNVAMGSWVAVNGSYSVTTTVAADGNEVLIKQGNNTSTVSFFVGRGANMPYAHIEAESAGVTTTGTKLVPNNNLGDFAGEASGRSAVYLNATGQYVEFTLPASANAFVMRNAIANSADGVGIDGTVSVYVNGVSKGKMNVSSKFSYVYATPTTLSNLGYSNSVGGTAYWLYEEANMMLDQVYPAGTKLRIQKDTGDVSWIYVDFVETENVAPPASNPDPTKYIQVSATESIDQALTDFRADTTKLGIFIPAGNWPLSTKIFVYGRATQIIGAGPWHTRLIAPQDQTGTDMGFNIASTANGSVLKDLSAWGNYRYRIDGPGKFIDGNGMQNVTIDNVWIEHFICMYWGVNSSNNTFKNLRIRNTFADGINMTNSSSNNIITNSDARGTGDDSFAEFSAIDAGGSYNVGNQYTNLTATCVRRAAAFAAYGGYGNTYQNLYGADTQTYPGLTISSLSFGLNTLGFGSGDTVFDGITLDRTGGDFYTAVGSDDHINDYQNFAAIWVFSGDKPFQNILVKNIDINNPVYFGIMLQNKYPEKMPMTNVRFENININNAPRYGIKLVVRAEGTSNTPPVGSASFTNVKVNNSGVAAIYGEAASPEFTVVRLSGDNF